MIRVGIVGSRFAANLHALGLRQAPGADLMAAASPNAEDAWGFYRRYEIPHVFKDYKDMLDSGFVDAVTVACPNDLHCEVTLAAGAAGGGMVRSQNRGRRSRGRGPRDGR